MGIQLVALVLVATVAPAPGLKAPVSLHTNGTTVAEVVRQLRGLTQTDLRVTSQLGKEVVLVDVDGVPADELMSRLAWVMHAEWAKSGESYQLLLRDTEQKNAVNARIARETSAFKDAVDKMLAPAGASPQQGGRSSRWRDAQRAVAHVLSQVPPATLARVAPGARVVFTNMPFGVQVALPGPALTAVRQAMADQLAATPAPRPNDRAAQRRYESLRTGTYAKAYLVVQRPGWSPVLTASVRVVDQAGDQLLFGSTAVVATPAPESGAGDSAAKVKLSDEARLMVGTRRQARGGDKAIVIGLQRFESARLLPADDLEVDQSAASLMLDPVARDPLSFFVGEAVRQTMPADKPAVALLSDELFETVRQVLFDKDASVAAVRDAVSRDGYEWEEKDGWAAARPVDITRDLGHRLDRAAFKRVVDSSRHLGVASLDALVPYAQASPSLTENSWDTAYAQALGGNTLRSQFLETRGSNREAMLVYGSLPVNGRNQPRAAFPVGSAVGPVADLLFWSSDGPQKSGQPRRAQTLELTFRAGRSGNAMQFQANSGGSFERTDVFSAVPAQTQVLVTNSAENVLRVLDPLVDRAQVYSPRELAATRAVAETRPGAVDKPSADTKYQLMSRRRVMVTLSFAGQYTMSRLLTDYEPIGGSEVTAFEGLPQGVRDEYDRTFAKLSQNVQVRQRGRPGRVPPP
ncbi:MAG: hypothetical protein KF857_01735 [Fimbriimonadaceae bacterium]|nr:hypothetical protein [Fimbriimonadaceae bacterium]